MKIYSKIILLICVVCLTDAVFAQKTVEKPLNKWSKDNALEIINTSPWAKTYQSTNSLAAASQQQVARDQSQSVNSGGGGSGARSVARNLGAPPVVIRLHSALPVRQALIRLQQLAANYEKMDEKQKIQFDASAKSFLDCAVCQNYYVVTLTQFTDSSGQSIEEGIFQGMTLKDLQGNVWLVNDKGERRELVQFTPPKGRGDSAAFFFARKDDKGNVLLMPDSKDFKFEFKNEFLTSGNNRYAALVPRNFEFKVSKMMVGDKFEF